MYPDVYREIILNQACGELGGQGAVTVYTHPATCTSFLPGLCACKGDSWNRLFVPFDCREQVTGKGGTMLVASTLKKTQIKN